MDIDLHARDIAALADHPGVAAQTRRTADAIARKGAAGAPVESGAGAASIHVEGGSRAAEWRVGWDPAHDYLKFHELGDEEMAARPFMRPAVYDTMAGNDTDPAQ